MYQNVHTLSHVNLWATSSKNVSYKKLDFLLPEYLSWDLGNKNTLEECEGIAQRKKTKFVRNRRILGILDYF